MTNFDFLRREPKFNDFSELAIEAERLYAANASLCADKCRKALEAAVKWVYASDAGLNVAELRDEPTLANLMREHKFKTIVGDFLWRRIDYVRKVGNQGAHDLRPVRREKAAECLESLFCFLDFLASCYSDVPTEEARKYDPALRDAAEAPENVSLSQLDEALQLDVDRLIAENQPSRERFAALRQKRQELARPKEELLEWDARKRYIDVALEDAGWIQESNWLDEYYIEGVPTPSGTGKADYALLDDRGTPCAIIEAKKTSEGVEAGREQARQYADALEQKHGRRPIVFLTNGFEWRIDDGVYPERVVSEIYSPRDLEKLFNLRALRGKLGDAPINEKIVNRAYQQEAVRRVCEAFEAENRRKALLVMATGSGKTRTAMAICDVLQRQYWAKHILFLADRDALVNQAKVAFGKILDNMSCVDLRNDKKNADARFVFSTYPTMANCVDSASDEKGRLYTPGHFDLVICDEAHRSIYKKYRAIFEYFDAPLLGMTATPKDEIDRNTYELFELEDGSPTFAYDLADAVRDGWLVDYKTVETKLKFIEEGITYDDLSDEEKEQYEETFADEDGNIPESIDSKALNDWLFNKDTIAKVLNILDERGLKVDGGLKLGKTIIFAKKHEHAEKIREIFYQQYPNRVGYAKVIDNKVKGAQALINDFSDKNKLPQIAMSVDMLDTGIDVPEVLNLVFFKKVRSKSKFWQMIGRGTRLCDDLFGVGENKELFYIFDFCGNFEFFRVNKKGSKGQYNLPLQGRLFLIKAEIAMKLQKAEYQTPELIALRKSLVDELVEKVRALNRDNFAVRRALRSVEKYSSEQAFDTLTNDDLRAIRDDLTLLIESDAKADKNAFNFDGLIYAIETAALEGKKNESAIKRVFTAASALTEHANLPQIQAKSELLEKIVGSDYLLKCGVDDFEHIRKELRDLIKFIPVERKEQEVNFTDEILSIETNDSELVGLNLEGYKKKTERYLRENKLTNPVVAKLYENVPLNPDDVAELERLLWTELGTKQDYQKEYGDKELGALVREIVGLDQHAAQEAFAKFLNDATLNSGQIYFINAIVKHIVANGMLVDLGILMDSPFTDYGGFGELFGDSQTVFQEITETIKRINNNALGA